MCSWNYSSLNLNIVITKMSAISTYVNLYAFPVFLPRAPALQSGPCTAIVLKVLYTSLILGL